MEEERKTKVDRDDMEKRKRWSVRRFILVKMQLCKSQLNLFSINGFYFLILNESCPFKILVRPLLKPRENHMMHFSV